MPPCPGRASWAARRGRKYRHRRNRVFRAVRIGRVTLHAGCGQVGRHRPTSADLQRIAQPFRAGRLADKTGAHRFARLLQIQSRIARVPCSASALLVAGDGYDHRAVQAACSRTKSPTASRNECRNARLQCSQAPRAPRAFRPQYLPKRRAAPSLPHRPAGRRPYGQLKPKVRGWPFSPQTREEVRHTAPVDAGSLEPGPGQFGLEKPKCASFLGRDRGAANKLSGSDQRGSSWVMGTRYRAPPPPAIRGTEGTCGPATRRRTATPLDLPDLPRLVIHQQNP